MKKALLIIAPENYHDAELKGTRDMIVDAGFEVVLGSSQVGECKGKLGGSEGAQIALKDVNVNDYNRIAFIGGAGSRIYFDNPDALRIAHETVRLNKPLGAICIAPLILAKARVLEGRRATVWNGDSEQQGELEKYGAVYTGDDVTVDGMIVTANGPPAAEEFGRTLASL
ncbi:DJ-1/PfpI family protein [Patescibacteria group bacterium]|nr:DJ-1/PfpI family protein [Patescibacteria group bacterium]MBU1123475.1 DJ-1/PfpI family protein [Patescibacteria group bacterium]